MSELPRRVVPKERVRALNSKVAELLSLYLNLTPSAITPDMVRGVADDAGISSERAYAMLLSMMCGVDPYRDGAGEDEKTLYYNYFAPMVHELDAAQFESDPYYRNIKIPEKTVGKWRLTNMTLAPCEAFVCSDFVVTGRGELIPQIGYFMREFRYPAILEDGREWMTLMPNETVTTLPSVERAHGKVLTYGLGLGYFAYMASRKESVESVTVVELSRDAASLFEAEILPQFERRDKIKVIVADAVEYARTTAVTDAPDFIFADIWHDAADGPELYHTFKSFEPLYPPSTEFAYWLEDTILCYDDRSLWE